MTARVDPNTGTPATAPGTGSGTGLPARSLVEDFLYAEADILDNWDLQAWLGLFEEGGTYSVPSTDTPDGSPESSLFLIADSWARLQSRVKRLESRNAHVESPRSRTRRFITNVRVAAGPDEGTVAVTANFVVYRFKHEKMDQFVGRYHHVLVPNGDTFRFRSRKAVLDLEALRPAGKVSGIL